VIWFYRRDRAALQVETRFDNATNEYVVIVRPSDGGEESHRFLNRTVFRAWLLQLEERLEQERWESDGAPHIIPDGWPNRPPMM